MRSFQIQQLIDAIEKEFGSITLYGSHESEEHGTCFILSEIPATFSVLTLEGELPDNVYSDSPIS